MVIDPHELVSSASWDHKYVARLEFVRNAVSDAARVVTWPIELSNDTGAWVSGDRSN